MSKELGSGAILKGDATYQGMPFRRAEKTAAHVRSSGFDGQSQRLKPLNRSLISAASLKAIP
jgi:hypothetical protein